MSEKTQSQAAKERVIEEKRQLDEKIKKLYAFLVNEEKVSKIPTRQKSLLGRQLDIMTDYSDILNKRLLWWED